MNVYVYAGAIPHLLFDRLILCVGGAALQIGVRRGFPQPITFRPFCEQQFVIFVNVLDFFFFFLRFFGWVGGGGEGQEAKHISVGFQVSLFSHGFLFVFHQ